MDITTALARYVIGTLDLRLWPAIALQALEQGYDSLSLVILAGLSEKDYADRIDFYLRATLRELNWTLPDSRCAALAVAKSILEEIFSGRTTVWKGVQRLLNEVINRDFFEETNTKYVHDGIAFSEVHGLFYSLDELPVSRAWPWQKRSLLKFR